MAINKSRHKNNHNFIVLRNEIGAPQKVLFLKRSHLFPELPGMRVPRLNYNLFFKPYDTYSACVYSRFVMLSIFR